MKKSFINTLLVVGTLFSSSLYAADSFSKADYSDVEPNYSYDSFRVDNKITMPVYLEKIVIIHKTSDGPDIVKQIGSIAPGESKTLHLSYQGYASFLRIYTKNGVTTAREITERDILGSQKHDITLTDK